MFQCTSCSLHIPSGAKLSPAQWQINIKLSPTLALLVLYSKCNRTGLSICAKMTTAYPYSLQVTQSTDHNVCRSCSLHPVLYCLPAIHTANHSICRLNTIQSADYTFCRPSVCRLYILQTIQSTDHTGCLLVGLSAASITSYGSGNCPLSQKKTLCVRQSIR